MADAADGGTDGKGIRCHVRVRLDTARSITFTCRSMAPRGQVRGGFAAACPTSGLDCGDLITKGGHLCPARVSRWNTVR
jgi:hypothetical protein